MEELNDMAFDNSGWLTRFKTLKHDYEHHMEEEENEIFNKAKEVLPDAGDGSYGKNFLERKEAERGLVHEKAESKLTD